MSLGVQHGRFYCTTSETECGPQCASDQEAAVLANHIRRTRGVDTRDLDMPARLRALEEVRDGSALTMETHSAVACLCGSGEPWVARLERRGKAARTTCAVCNVDIYAAEPAVRAS